MTIADNFFKNVRFGIHLCTSTKDKRSKLYGRGTTIKVSSLKVAKSKGNEQRIIEISKVDQSHNKSMESIASIQSLEDDGEEP